MEKAQRRWLEERRAQLVGKSVDPEIDNIKYTWVKDFGHGITVSCGRGRYFRIEDSEFKKRFVTFKFSRLGMPDASALFFEWDCPGLVDVADFVDVADSNSQEDYEMAAAVGECWSDECEYVRSGIAQLARQRIVLIDWPSLVQSVRLPDLVFESRSTWEGEVTNKAGQCRLEPFSGFPPLPPGGDVVPLDPYDPLAQPSDRND